jgi:hypothetical protein
MRIDELIDFLKTQPGDAEVELAVVRRIDPEGDDILVEQYSINAVMPWPSNDADEEDSVWLIGAEDDDDVEQLIDALEDEAAARDPRGGEHAHDHGPGCC